MDIETLIQNITPEIYENLKTAVELGKWANGEVLSEEQRQLCMQAVIMYERTLPEQERSGYIEQSCKSSSNDDDTQNITIQ